MESRRCPQTCGKRFRFRSEVSLFMDSLGEPVFKSFIENKKIEWENYHSRVADYETEHYLPVL